MEFLRSLINVFYYLVLVAIVIFIAALVFGIAGFDGTGVVLKSISRDASVIGISKWVFTRTAILAVLLGLSVAFFVKGIYHLRAATLDMIDNNIHKSSISRHLYLTGAMVIANMTCKVAYRFIKSLTIDHEFSIGLDVIGYDSSVFLLILGLFFILLSKVIDQARLVKQEQDLTI